ncbi:MAG: hypothetical protein ACRDTA_01960 [Pseudonocardiaceae bacterium]
MTVLDRFTLSSTDGEPIEHVRISCPASHHFRMARDRLTETIAVAEAASAAVATAGTMWGSAAVVTASVR